jgi:hypothetical protein
MGGALNLKHLLVVGAYLIWLHLALPLPIRGDACRPLAAAWAGGGTGVATRQRRLSPTSADARRIRRPSPLGLVTW